MNDLKATGDQPMELSSVHPEDVRLDEIIAAWAGSEEDLDVPDVRGSHFVGLPQDASSPEPAAVRPRGTRQGIHRPPRWGQAAALAAGLALLCFGTWQVQELGSSAPTETSPLAQEGWKAVTGESATRVSLQFSVENRSRGEALVAPGRAGQEYGADDSLILRVDLRGEPAWVYLVEQGVDGVANLLHPSAGAEWYLAAGSHSLSSKEGLPLAYRPDSVSGKTRYLAIATSTPADGAKLATEVQALGLDRPDLWPRTVRAVDSFVVGWME